MLGKKLRSLRRLRSAIRVGGKPPASVWTLAWVLAAAMMLSLAPLSRAALPMLPADAITEKTIFVVYINGAEMTPDKMQQAMNAVAGPQGAANANLDDIRKRYQQLSQDGAQAVIVTSPYVAPEAGAAAAPDQQTAPVVYIQLKQGADVEAMKKVIAADMDRRDLESTQFSRSGDFLVIRDKNAPAPAPASAERAKDFADAFAAIEKGGPQPVSMVVIPTEKARADMKTQLQGAAADFPPAVGDLLAAASDGKWAGLTVTLGNAPVLTITIEAKDAASADALEGKVNATLDQFKQMMQGNGGGAAMAMILQPILNGLKVTEESPRVLVSLDLKSLSTILAVMPQPPRPPSTSPLPNGEMTPAVTPPSR